MSCGPQGCTSLNGGMYPEMYCSPAGRNITGRSTPGYDVRYKNMNVPQSYPTSRIAQSRAQAPALSPDFGSFVVGLAIGFIIAAFVLTPTGREVGRAAGTRTAKRIRG